ncbi:hypothetical protein ITP53_27405 [Nonomuraea sp. K274]|uniref:Uncharacterized protein n=2 Tax=Nonomuraea cypriaca TaxID=1187855 RepID=A0A931F0H0_9ACTN|nr:hypothetical protein [Nonomuraea cypriaca]
MYRFLLNAFRVTLIAFMLGGLVVTVFQIIGILIADGGLTSYFGADFADTICIVAGLAGVFSYLQLYTKEGRAAAQGPSGDEDTVPVTVRE